MESDANSAHVLPSNEPLTKSRSNTKIVDDVTSLTSFNPFSEEDEHDQSSYALVTSLFSKVKNTLAAPLSSAAASAVAGNIHHTPQNHAQTADSKRPSISNHASNQSSRSSVDRHNLFNVAASNPAPPLVSLTPVVSETPSYIAELDRPPSRNGSFYLPDTPDGVVYGTAIPGFPIQDSDARSIRTTGSIRRSASVSKVIRRIRGEGLSRDYWMDDELCKECYDCKSVFTAWRRKHHCRICGQIFCSRCASNIIKGARFGHNGMVRVCNLCLEKLTKVDDDDDDDRRSINSSMTSPFAAHQLGEALSFAHSHHPQSPFAASQLFGRTDEPFNLFSIAETKIYPGSDDSALASPPSTPLEEIRRDRLGRENPVPFRRALAEEVQDSVALPDKFASEDSPTAPGTKTPIDFPVTVPISAIGSMSSVQFPVTSPDQGHPFESPGMLRSRFNSYVDLEAQSPFIRSRVQSGIGERLAGHPGWRTRTESIAYAQELNLISMFHLRIMLRQMLSAEDIPNIDEWEETLLKLSMRIARELTFTAHPQRQGADMDVRRYVKIKKIPGGAPKDSEYVDGAVITKNVTYKQMARMQRNPRVMLVTFPLEFHRVEGQYMHFGQILRQEKDYLNNLATRIAALRPHVVLAEKSVSRLALDALAKHKIAVARTVKPSAIAFVARMTQGDVFSSMDKLALEPRLGHCARFRIQTFDHPLIPGRRKTYMRFEGCNREMGCTIVLRGGDIDTLRRVKKVTRFLAFIVRNLRLETHLWKDSVITLPALTAEATPPVQSSADLSALESDASMPSQLTATLTQKTLSQAIVDATPQRLPASDIVDDLPDEDAEEMRLSRRIQESIEPYRKTFLSVSATLRFPPPYPISRMKELDDELTQIKREWEDEVIRREERGSAKHQQEATFTQQSIISTITPDMDDVAAQIESLPLPEVIDTPISSDDGSTPAEHTGYFESLLALPHIAAPSLPQTPSEELPVKVVTAEDIRLESRLNYLKWQHAEYRRVWEWYLRKNRDDFDVEKYQCISLWEITLPMTESGLHPACFPPRLRYITFYGENDCTLGHYIEQAARDAFAQFMDAKAICENKACNQPLARHCTVYVHNETRLLVAVEQWDGQINQRSLPPDTIITWSICSICEQATPFIPLSPEVQRYSFAKFLELHFYPADVQLVPGAGCQHNIYRHHIRYFAIQQMTIRFQADPVVLHEVVYPPMRVRVRPETQLEIKNSDFERLHTRNNMWYTALIDDLKLINIDAATGDEEADAKLTIEINQLIIRAEWEKADIARLINTIYSETAPTDTLALNQIRAYRQDKMVAWQQDFDKLPKPKVTQLLDRNSRKSSAFGSVRAMFPRRSEYYGSLENAHNVSEAEDYGRLVKRRLTGGSLVSTSSTSDASESESVMDKTAQRAPTETAPSTIGDQLPTASCAELESSPRSDVDSDSTIGATRAEQVSVELSSSPQVDHNVPDIARTLQRASRLPRRPTNYPSVAELVKKYQDYLPARGVEELTKTALPPAALVCESGQETSTDLPPPVRNKSRRRMINGKSSISDFESSYAVNVAPRYLTHARRTLGPTPYSARIPPPAIPFESRTTSRRASPDKRSATLHSNADAAKIDKNSPPLSRLNSLAKRRGKATNRPTGMEKATSSRFTGAVGSKSTVKKPPGLGSKVSNIAKHFERISKDTERTNRRYSVIRGRRPRPVASARAKVEVLDSIKDAIQDESESSDSSEADDEGDGDDEMGKSPKQNQMEASHSSETFDSGQYTQPMNVPPQKVTAEVIEHAQPQDGERSVSTDGELLQTPAPAISTPSSPMLTAMNHAPIPMAPITPELDVGSTGTERYSILKTLSGFWPQQLPQSRIRADVDADDPLADPEHIFRDSSMVVRTDEPTSIIALALNSPQYRDMLAKSRAEKRQTREPKLTDGGEAFMPDDRSVAESTSTWGVVNVDSPETYDPTEELRVPSSKQPWAISFESGGLTIACTVLYPEQFDALRRTYDCERSMIESLARCVKWNASGGKSGSAFLKTLDDRFIAKELSRAELQAMETFAPAYFDYMSSAVVANRPTLLAKIFGCFKLTFRTSHKHQGPSRGNATQMNLLVMENLFYDRRFSKIYDLKGSTRNRHVQCTGRENEVLLDENLVETAHLAPFYLREHSKRILRGALFNDSKFLAEINVMDYSLVVGVDSLKNELVVGIVDYIRTYTWDKKLESWVKDSAFLGGANRGEPTIISPRQYRQRFLSAMERYFPLVPDRWMKQHDAPEDEGNALLDLWPDW
ncbi:uncharacterized protein LAESUDRAFT_757348 [Laetiporus sulphureus 93-53]|uniref:1-phosphatidylinositol-3-phosphate 5-kinase n=1 Tax=Laetiporus sulphureus 93-53 TaxID=1314785 RepID=A0A165F9B5_9APHY|nr:uncharacterized protein LAESUDRAFT_757348 [Laetiporus sulphureus 93-53]KZT08628.1 hypothetical protein LAESUDRAFT_757348 [Laetiporus sulphureus 93-53]